MPYTHLTEKERYFRHCSTITGNMSSSPCIMKRPSSLQPALSLGIPEHVHRDALTYVRPGADAVNGLLHFPVSAVASLHGVGGRRQQRIIQEGQRLFQRGRELENRDAKSAGINRHGVENERVLRGRQ